MKSIVYILIPCFCLFLACEKSRIENPAPKDPVPVEDVQAVANISSDFGWKLFQTIAREEAPDKNVLISPLSVQTALSMAVNGADSGTLDEMLQILGCEGCSVRDLNTQTAKLRILMEEQSGHPTLTSANGFFYDQNRVHVLETFINALSTDYRAGFQTYNFGDPATKDKINAWVKAQTNDKIDGIIDQINDLDLAFLINALHFTADWATGFASDMTHQAAFNTRDGRVIQVPFVSADRDFTFVQQGHFSMVDIPFRDSTYSLSLIRKNGDSPLASWADEVSVSQLKEMWSSLSYGRAWVSFPKLDLEYDKSLIPSLKEMGMRQAFQPGLADFSKLGHALIGPTIYISTVRHKAVLKVDEKGAEGAAVTSIGFSTTSLPPVITFNSPFILVLRHVETNAIVFAGVVNDPS